MTRRRNPPPRRPGQGPARPPGRKDEQSKENDLRLTRALRKAQDLQKQRLRRHDFDDADDEPGAAAAAGEEEDFDLGDAIRNSLDSFDEEEDAERD